MLKSILSVSNCFPCYLERETDLHTRNNCCLLKLATFTKANYFSPVFYLRVQFWYGNYPVLHWYGVKLIRMYFLVIHHSAVWVLTFYTPQSEHELPTYFLRLWFGFILVLLGFGVLCLFVKDLTPNLDERSSVLFIFEVLLCLEILLRGGCSGLLWRWRKEADLLDDNACSCFLKWTNSSAHEQ